MNTHMPGFQLFLSFFLHNFVLSKIAISSINVNNSAISGEILDPYNAEATFIQSTRTKIFLKSN